MLTATVPGITFGIFPRILVALVSVTLPALHVTLTTLEITQGYVLNYLCVHKFLLNPNNNNSPFSGLPRATGTYQVKTLFSYTIGCRWKECHRNLFLVLAMKEVLLIPLVSEARLIELRLQATNSVVITINYHTTFLTFRPLLPDTVSFVELSETRIFWT